MYRRILVPVDDSPASTRGLREAIRLAKEGGAKLRLVHVTDISQLIGGAEFGVDAAAIVDAFRERGDAILEKAARIAKKQGVEAERALKDPVSGRAAEAIVAEAKRWRAELIVMGTHGRRGASRMLLGSDAELVARLAPVPLLLVRA